LTKFPHRPHRHIEEATHSSKEDPEGGLPEIVEAEDVKMSGLQKGSLV